MSLSRQGPKHWLYGKHVSQATKAKISTAKLGGKHSAETKEKMAAKRREYWRKRKESLITEKVTSWQ